MQKFLGHADPGLTLRLYVHLLPEDSPSFMAGLAGGQGNGVATSPAETGRDDEAADGAFPPSVQGFSSAEFGLSEAVANS